MTTYSQKLKDPRWQKRRLKILDRDNWACQVCHDTEETLHVHHLWYEKGEPWDSPDEALETLCANCHEDETALRPMNERDLIDMLRKCGFRATDIHELRCALYPLLLPNRYDKAKLILAFEVMLTNKETRELLITTAANAGLSIGRIGTANHLLGCDGQDGH